MRISEAWPIANEVEVKVSSGSGKQVNGKVPWKIVDFERTAMPLYVPRASRGCQHFHVSELFGYQTGVLQQPYTDCAVYAFLNEVDTSVAEADSKVHWGYMLQNSWIRGTMTVLPMAGGRLILRVP